MEAYDVTVEIYDRDKHRTEWFSEAENNTGGICSIEIWRDKDGLIHRDDGPALIMRDTQSGKAVAEGWYSRGEFHREGDMPAVTWGTGFLWRQWYQNGLLHRDAGPAHLVTTTDAQREKVYQEDWYRHGKRHRIGGPARLMVSDETGVVMSEGWYQDGKHHRIDGPASIQRSEYTGVAYEERWCQYGRDYRADGGPTFIDRDEKSGEVIDFGGPRKAPPPKPAGP